MLTRDLLKKRTEHRKARESPQNELIREVR
jgi:hypothetical protein